MLLGSAKLTYTCGDTRTRLHELDIPKPPTLISIERLWPPDKTGSRRFQWRKKSHQRWKSGWNGVYWNLCPLESRWRRKKRKAGDDTHDGDFAIKRRAWSTFKKKEQIDIGICVDSMVKRKTVRGTMDLQLCSSVWLWEILLNNEVHHVYPSNPWDLMRGKQIFFAVIRQELLPY